MKPLSRRSVRDVLFDDENTFREVKDWAWILNQRLNETEPISDEELRALGRVAAHLFEVGVKLDELFDEMFHAHVAERKRAA